MGAVSGAGKAGHGAGAAGAGAGRAGDGAGAGPAVGAKSGANGPRQ